MLGLAEAKRGVRETEIRRESESRDEVSVKRFIVRKEW
tara:strand:+ start:226 stop:339 length:114 start_codon:yes stop_codon:yes gene_type:complete